MGNAACIQFLFQSFDVLVLIVFLSCVNKDDVVGAELFGKEFVHLCIKVGLGGVYLINVGVGKDIAIFGCKGYYQSDTILFGKFGERFDVFGVSGSEDDVHLLQFGFGQQGLDG